MRMTGEEAIREGDLEGDEEPEGQTDQARRDSKTVIERGKASARVSEWGANHHGDKHHAGDGANAKDQKIGDGPTGIANFRENEQSNRGRACKTMNETNGQRAKKLIKSELP